ncbi:MAG TPA: hypothetical protein VJ805_15185 [Nitrospiraceae bacterium]|nr:hypothetical protein [Nitrospiraceae bacterium]
MTEAEWPGNVRELQHYIERAVVAISGPELSCKDIVAMESRSESSDLRRLVRGAAQQVERTQTRFAGLPAIGSGLRKC